MTEQVTLAGCTPIPLANYLKALGVLRLVAEQADRNARGYWLNEQFVLDSDLDAVALRQFFLEKYRPTPLLAPWGARSGFYPGSAESGARTVLQHIEATSETRLEFFRKSINAIRELLEQHGFEKKPGDDQRKLALMQLCRAELDEDLVHWLDACYTLTANWRRFPPLLGTGGNEGSGSYLAGFGQLVVDCLSERKFDPALDAALFQQTVPDSGNGQVPGQFAPYMAGGTNQSTGYSGGVITNPWDFLLALEGTLLFASSSSRRLESNGPSSASIPFTTLVTGTGSGRTAIADEAGSRAEMWVPLWESAASIYELRSVLNEGRATLGQTSVRDGLDFARAVSHLGIDRGLSSFQRYMFIQRYGRNVFAVPLNRVPVRRNPAANIINELDSRNAGYWLSRFRSHARREGANRLLSLARRLEDALFELAASRDDQGPVVRRLLVALGEIQLYLARSPKARDNCPPVPRLSAQWLTRADDGSPEMSIAAALAGLHARDGKGAWMLPLRHYLAPEKGGGALQWDEQADHAVIWHAGARIEDNLAGVLARGLLECTRGGLPDKPLHPLRTAPLADVADWLNGKLDNHRLARLLPGLALVDIPKGCGRSATRSLPLPAAYRLLKPLFSTDEQLLRAERIPAETHLPLPREIPRRLQSGDVTGALEQGLRRLRTTGIRTGLHAVNPGYRDGRRLLAALMIPISDPALKSLWHAEDTTEYSHKAPETE